MSLFNRRSKREPVPYPRLIVTVAGYGDLIVTHGQRNASAMAEAIVWDKADPWLTACSTYYYGPDRVSVRTSAITTVRIEDK